MRLVKCEQNIEEILEKVYVDSEFLEPLEGVIVETQSVTAVSYVAYENETAVGFFIVDADNSPVDFKRDDPSSCWLKSFMIAEEHQGKGYGKQVLSKMATAIKRDLPQFKTLNLTVNFRNHAAKQLYLKCGFKDTRQVYEGGPAGPQHIFSRKI